MDDGTNLFLKFLVFFSILGNCALGYNLYLHDISVKKYMRDNSHLRGSNSTFNALLKEKTAECDSKISSIQDKFIEAHKALCNKE